MAVVHVRNSILLQLTECAEDTRVRLSSSLFSSVTFCLSLSLSLPPCLAMYPLSEFFFLRTGRLLRRR